MQIGKSHVFFDIQIFASDNTRSPENIAIPQAFRSVEKIDMQVQRRFRFKLSYEHVFEVVSCL